MSAPVLEIEGLAKTFGGVKALQGVDLTVRAGEIHGLLGQNGSGKSTLIKVLAGFHQPDAGGRLRVNGEEVSLPLAPGDYQRLGMRFVHQDLGLIPSLSVLENLFLDEIATTGSMAIRWSSWKSRAKELFARYGVALNPSALVADLRPVERALLAIVRAVATAPSNGLLVLDEPTVFLPQDDTQMLFDVTRTVAATGTGVLFVSHDLEEVKQLTDRFTVFRDGAVVGSGATKDFTRDQIVRLIVGHDLVAVEHRSAAQVAAADVATTAYDVAGGLVAQASLTLHKGEVLGVTGLSGSGFEDLPYLLFGAHRADTGRLEVAGVTVDLRRQNPTKAFDQGLALVPADRQRDGAILSLSVLDNVSMQTLNRYQQGPILRRRRMRDEARGVLGSFDVRPSDPTLPCSSLSGGNQQKVLMAKWLQTRPTVLMVHEPTQGVDVGAREEIFTVLRSATAEGMGVLCASSDHEQLALICDRVLIFRQGRIVAELSGSQVTKERISELSYAVPESLETQGSVA
jgi:ribose transport system ATP-binding protein